jgi:tetratricopeptide (TPR) repeat protein
MQTSIPSLQPAVNAVALALVLGLVVWGTIRTLKRSEDPARLIFKWGLTALVIAFVGRPAARIVEAGGYAGAFGGIPLTALCGLLLAIIWRHNIIDIVAKPFASLYDGGDVEIEPQPYYSIAEARRKMGKYTEAVAEIRKQLDKFPTDLQGQLMLAEIQAENLNDLPGAELTIHRLCAQPGHAPRNIAFGLNTLADWHLKFALDCDAAREDLQQVVDLFPDTDLALIAAQRIAHLAGTDQLLAPHDRQRVAVPEGVKNLGLLQSTAHLARTETDPAKLADEFVKHLERHPQDSDAREKLAVIYADHYGRLDLAADQLDQLIEQPNQPAKLVVHWLNLLADLQLRHGAHMDTVRPTLERIIERYPNHAAAEIARHRLNLLRLEIKARENPLDVKMGTYEQNIGLK